MSGRPKKNPKPHETAKTYRHSEGSSMVRREVVAAVESESMTALPSHPAYNPQSAPLYFFRVSEPKTGFLSNWYASEPFTDSYLSPPTTRTVTSVAPLKEMKIYKTAEHYMMHHKALLFGDAAAAEEILDAEQPWKVQKLGRLVEGFDQEVWERERERIVRDAVYWKFTSPVSLIETQLPTVVPKVQPGENGPRERQPEGIRVWKLSDSRNAPLTRSHSFRAALLATGDRLLVEASPFDRTWGIGFSAKVAESKREFWGLNLLGRCLMEVREQFRKEEEQ